MILYIVTRECFIKFKTLDIDKNLSKSFPVKDYIMFNDYEGSLIHIGLNTGNYINKLSENNEQKKYYYDM